MADNIDAAIAAATPLTDELPKTDLESQEGTEEGSNESSNPLEAKVEAKKEAEIKKTLKKLKIKYNGKEMEEDLPFEIPDDEKSRDYMTKQLQFSKQSQMKAQEYSNLEKEVKSFIEALRKDPRKVLQDPSIGIDVKKLAASIIEEEINNSQKSPEQIAKEQIEAELKSLKAEREQEKEDSKKKEFERVQTEAYERYDMQMSQALEKSDLPKSPYVVKKMADYMLIALQNGVDITAEEVVPLVRQEMTEDLKQMFAVMPEDVIEQLVGKDTITRLRKKSLAKAKAAPPTPLAKSVADTGTSKPKDPGKSEMISFKDFFKI